LHLFVGQELVAALNVFALGLVAGVGEEEVAFVHHGGVTEVVEGERESALLVGGVVQHRYVGVDYVGLPLQDVQEGLATEFAVISQVEDGVNAQTHVLLVDVELGSYVDTAETVDDFDSGG
jgi:hypothetical protein